MDPNQPQNQNLNPDPFSQPQPLVSLPTPTAPLSSNKSDFLKTFFIVISLVLFGIFIGVLTTRFIPILGTVATPTLNQAISPELTFEQDMPIDPTTSWKTYTNTQYKYSIKYPSDMVLEEMADDPFYPSYVIFKNEANQFNIRATESTVLATTETIRSQTEGHVLAELIKNETMQIGNVIARLLEYSAEDINNNRSTLIIPSGKNVIIINAQSDIFDQILSTFKFLDQITDSSTKNLITQEQAVQQVSSLPEVKDYLNRVPNGKIAFDHEDQQNNKWVIHVYENLSDHQATFNWYDVDKITGTITKMFDV